MLPAQERLAVDLEGVSFKNLAAPLVTNVDAAIIHKGAEARDALVRQVSSPVRWLESMELLIKEGVDTFVEVGPGKVLTGLLRQISRDVRGFNVEDAASLKSAAANLGI
jgi:[acyl-carrier-protein] S-malonyltransferase